MTSVTTSSALGATPSASGTTFRVWAPHADAVWVTGDFNDWSADSTPLAAEPEGLWAADVPSARAGHEYKFVIRNGDQTFHRIDPYAAQVTNSVGNGVVYDHGAFDWQGDDFHIRGHHELIVYELHIGSFAPRSEDEVGTLTLAIDKLDHLVNLGVNAIQIMPVAEFAGDYSWGYNPAHIFAVESGYGGPDGLKTLVREAHRKGLAVILDVVYNHFGPSDLDLWQFDGWSEHGKGGIYFYNDDRSATPWGDTRPDYGRPEVRRFIHDNASMWLRDYHLDGLRYDMTPYIRSVNASGRDLLDGWELMRDVNTALRESFPGIILIAEDMQQDPAITQPAPDGTAFHAQWDGAFVHPVREAVIADDDAWRSMASIADAVTRVYNGDGFQRVIYTESHDEVANGRARVVSEVDADDPTGWAAQKRSTVGAALVLTAPGIPMLFQGQEFLQGEWFRDDVPVDWHLSDEFHGIVRLYRDLSRLRRNWHDTTRGLSGHHVEVTHLDEDANVIAFHRWADGGPGDSVMVVVNLSRTELREHAVRMASDGEWSLELNTDARVYSDAFGDFPSGDTVATPTDDGARAPVSIAPYSVLVYSKR